MISICREYADPSTHQFVTELVDSFGTKMIVQTRILEADHAPAVEEAKFNMLGREAAFVAVLKGKHGFSDAQIDAMKKSPGDCGCQ